MMAADLEIQALILFSGDNRQGVKEQSSIPARQGRSCQQRVPSST